MEAAYSSEMLVTMYHTGYIGLLQIGTTKKAYALSVLRKLQFTGTQHLCLLSLLCFHLSSGDGFHRRTFPFLWAPERSPCLSHSNSRLADYPTLNKTLLFADRLLQETLLTGCV
jgi:hypothetical protein